MGFSPNQLSKSQNNVVKERGGFRQVPVLSGMAPTALFQVWPPLLGGEAMTLFNSDRGEVILEFKCWDKISVPDYLALNRH